MKNKLKYSASILILVFMIVFTISCIPVNKLRYFNDIDELPEPAVNPREQKLIMPFDKLYIRIYSIDEKTNQLFNSNENLPMISSSSLIGYLVDNTGSINYPFIGKINVSGLTLEEAGLKLGKALSEFVSNAAVIVKFVDNNVTIMGQVQNQEFTHLIRIN